MGYGGLIVVFIEMNMNRQNLAYLLTKRVLDIGLATVSWLAASPLLITLAVLVKVTSPGPAFYRWQVVGENGRYFTSFKFRSMYENADAIKAELVSQNEMTGPVFKLANDPRVTPLGHILRKYSLDELPQLWSVIKGDMSLVGPRPPLQTEYVQFSEWQKQKLATRPGMTCLWQVQGRNDISDFDEWVRLDLEYIMNRSLSFDLKILLDTACCVLRGTGK